jgi:2'-5' RNA ligase
MFAIASLLDEAHDELVNELWYELESQFAVKIPYHDPLAHLSYQVFEAVGIDELAADLNVWVQGRQAFEVLTSGFGIFPGSRPVLYVPVVRGPEVHAFHMDLAHWLEGRGYSSAAVYSPRRWIPHITLAIVDGEKSNLQSVIRYLCSRKLSWTIEIDNLAIISGTRSPSPGLAHRMVLEPSRGSAR